MEATSQHPGLNPSIPSMSQRLGGGEFYSSSLLNSDRRLAGGSIASDVTRGVEDPGDLYLSFPNKTIDTRNGSTNVVKDATPELSNFHLDHLETSGMDSVMEPAMDHLKAFDKETQIADGTSSQAWDYAGLSNATCQSARTTAPVDMFKDSGQAHAETSQRETEINNPPHEIGKVEETSEVGSHHEPHLYSKERKHEGCDKRVRRQGTVRYK